MSIAALIVDGRTDEEVARQCVQFSKQSDSSAKLFQCFLEAAGCSEENLTEEG